MAYLNLLPWREAQRKQQQARFVTMLSVTGVVTFLAVFGVGAIYGAKVEGQNSRNNYLQSEITILDQRIVEIKQLEETAEIWVRRLWTRLRKWFRQVFICLA